MSAAAQQTYNGDPRIRTTRKSISSPEKCKWKLGDKERARFMYRAEPSVMDGIMESRRLGIFSITDREQVTWFQGIANKLVQVDHVIVIDKAVQIQESRRLPGARDLNEFPDHADTRVLDPAGGLGYSTRLIRGSITGRIREGSRVQPWRHEYSSRVLGGLWGMCFHLGCMPGGGSLAWHRAEPAAAVSATAAEEDDNDDWTADDGRRHCDDAGRHRRGYQRRMTGRWCSGMAKPDENSVMHSTITTTITPTITHPITPTITTLSPYSCMAECPRAIARGHSTRMNDFGCVLGG
ncbi:hypothetical protein BDZ89DRAFT_1044166 [Hymenopellis radicata]|nr:hypothetical protein BDZ89DRAFT_1044166 [Hymenopellis radicata]